LSISPDALLRPAHPAGKFLGGLIEAPLALPQGPRPTFIRDNLVNNVPGQVQRECPLAAISHVVHPLNGKGIGNLLADGNAGRNDLCCPVGRPPEEEQFPVAPHVVHGRDGVTNVDTHGDLEGLPGEEGVEEFQDGPAHGRRRDRCKPADPCIVVDRPVDNCMEAGTLEVDLRGREILLDNAGEFSTVDVVTAEKFRLVPCVSDP
jgi:hypothetical protein